MEIGLADILAAYFLARTQNLCVPLRWFVRREEPYATKSAAARLD